MKQVISREMGGVLEEIQGLGLRDAQIPLAQEYGAYRRRDGLVLTSSRGLIPARTIFVEEVRAYKRWRNKEDTPQ
jgi:hypothetical protein